MAECIEREAIIEFIRSYRSSTDVAFHTEEHLREIPSADVAPVRHGRWVMNDQSTPVCSRCGNVVAFVSHPDRKWDFGKYCPNCGAKMDEEG